MIFVTKKYNNDFFLKKGRMWTHSMKLDFEPTWLRTAGRSANSATEAIILKISEIQVYLLIFEGITKISTRLFF